MSNPPTTPASIGGPITTVTNAGLSLVRLGTSTISAPLKSVGDLGVSLIRLGTSVLTVPIAVISPQTRNEVVAASNEVTDAASKLYTTIVNAVIGGIDSVANSVTTAVNEAVQPTRK